MFICQFKISDVIQIKLRLGTANSFNTTQYNFFESEISIESGEEYSNELEVSFESQEVGLESEETLPFSILKTDYLQISTICNLKHQIMVA